MPRQSIIDQREITRDGTIQIRIAKQVVEDGEVLAESWHRCSIAPTMDAESVIAAVNADLTAQGYGAVPAEQWDRVRANITVEQPAEVKAAYQAKIEASEPANA